MIDGAASAELLGRQEELVALGAFLDALHRGASAFVVDGEAGIGKTAVWQAGLRQAAARGFVVVSCRPTGSEAGYSFAALGDLLQGVLADTLWQLPPAQRAALEQALLLVEADGPPVNERAVALGFLGVLRSLAEGAPVVVAADDTQWCDRPTAAVLEFTARRLGDAPIGLLLARRSAHVDPAPLGLERALPEERLRRLRLGGLSVEALHELLRSRLEIGLARPILLRLHEASGGNPFFALEIGRALLRSGRDLSAGAPLPVPETLRELVHERLAQLPARTREALLLAAALSRPTLPLVDAALSRGASAAAALEKAVEADVAEVGTDGGIRFSHPLLASGLYSEASLARRRRLHGRLAAVLDDPEEAARHLALATEGPDSSVAAALDRAAAAARARGAPAAAAMLNEQARRLTPAACGADLWRRTMEGFEFNYQAGDPLRARQLAEEAVGLAPDSDARAKALDNLGRVWMYFDLRRALRCFLDALAEDGLEAGTRAAAEEGLAATTWMIGSDYPAAAARARSAVASADKAGSVGLPTIMMMQAHMEAASGVPNVMALVDRAVALAESTRRSGADHDRTDGFTDYEFHVFREARALRACFLWQFADRADEARTELRWFYEQAVERGDESSIPMLLLNLSGAEAVLGNWTEARRLVEEAHEGSLEMGRQPFVEGWCLTQRAFLDAVLGRVTSSREAAERALTLADEAGANDPRVFTFPTLGLLELSLGRAAEAHEYLAGAVAGAEAAGYVEPGMCGFVTDDVEALIALGRLDEAELLLARHEQRASAVGRASALAACARCRGLLSAARADLAGALTALENALAQHERLENPFARGRTLLALGVTQRRAKKKAAGRESLERALAIFEELGARLWAERTRAELDRIGGRAGSRRELTPTEKQVAELVAAGHTNREVAAALSLSVRTVDWNLAKVYGKLGVHSRRELAALARRPTGS